jgi:hypothetical protein
VTLDCVEGGASIGFMHPLSRAKAVVFWQSALSSAGRGERIVLVASTTVFYRELTGRPTPDGT